MYEELIERLREAAECGRETQPPVCIGSHRVEHAYCNEAQWPMEQAADAIEKLQAELEQVKRERDAAVEHLRDHAGIVSRCWICKNKGDACSDCVGHDIWSENDHWEWRGVKEG